MITILHLYPRELGINGDVGNVMALLKRAEWRGLDARVLDHEVGAELPQTADLVHIGSGPASGQELVLDDLRRIAPRLREWSASGVPFVAIAAGWQLLGRTFQRADGNIVEGAGVFPTDSRASTKRIVREVWTEDAAGFENHGSVTTSDDPGFAWPVARFGGSLATNLHGPFLPMNPAYADELLSAAAARSGQALGAGEERVALVDERAARSRDAIRARLRL
ncbi:hypothetical protein HDC94_002001 [Leifsonia sp. AK011]|uniref:type 1 glutamine amidotransferase n=1 Tax=Leifsonia sp. AK011 TaxID=2723075 RepID=UPI0015CC281D|nr:cobyric acid synthase [Leifsonia sp. AK011]NYF10845.1 hypothetical protein [Leifsonia sp. AK011]